MVPTGILYVLFCFKINAKIKNNKWLLFLFFFCEETFNKMADSTRFGNKNDNGTYLLFISEIIDHNDNNGKRFTNKTALLNFIKRSDNSLIQHIQRPLVLRVVLQFSVMVNFGPNIIGNKTETKILKT